MSTRGAALSARGAAPRSPVPGSPVPVPSTAAAPAATGRAAGARAATGHTTEGSAATGHTTEGRAATAGAASTGATARVAAPLTAPASPAPAGPAPAGPDTAGPVTATATANGTAKPPPPPAGPGAAPPQPPRPAAPQDGPPGGRTRRWSVVLAATLGVVILLGSCGIFAYRLVQDELAGNDAQAGAGESPAPVERDITSRKADPEPLTVNEVFPNDEIVINPDEPPYEVLRTQKSKDCTVAAADALGNLLDKLGCNHVVRATLRSPDEGYLVSGGIFNLKTEADAERVYEEAKVMIGDESGRFLGLLAGDDTQPILLSQTNVGWDFRGHFVIYLIVARADGEPLTEVDNQHSKLILWDIAELHLRTNVLDGRALAPTAGPTPTTAAE